VCCNQYYISDLEVNLNYYDKTKWECHHAVYKQSQKKIFLSKSTQHFHYSTNTPVSCKKNPLKCTYSTFGSHGAHLVDWIPGSFSHH